jgi:hypothetical protein
MTSLIEPLSTQVPIVDAEGKPTPQFQRIMQILGVASGLTVTNGKIGINNNSITSAMIADGTIATIDIADNTITDAKLADMATQLIKARKSGTTGDPENCTISEILDFITGTAARGDILFRGATTWQRLAAGTSGKVLQTNGVGADPTWVTPSAGGASFRGALVTKSADQNAVNLTSATLITWNTETYDTDSIHDTVTNTDRLTVPTGVTYVRLQCQVLLNNTASGSWAYLSVIKNGVTTSYVGEPITSFATPDATAIRLTAISAVIPVVAGDFFSARISVVNDTSVDIVATASWFAMEIIQ